MARPCPRAPFQLARKHDDDARRTLRVGVLRHTHHVRRLSRPVVFGIGLPAAPGEPYADLPPTLTGRYADALDGYTVDGYKVHGKTVAAVRAELDRRGLKAVYQLRWSHPDGSFFPQSVSADQIKDDWVVERSRAYSSDTIDPSFPAPRPAPPPSLPRPHWWDLPEGSGQVGGNL